MIETDEGITGYGSSWELEEKFVKSMGQKLIGEDSLNKERIWAKIYVPKFIGRRGDSLKNFSAIDIALWDIKAKVANMPLCKFLVGIMQKAKE